MKICSIEGCGRKHLAKGYCDLHYWRNHRHGSPFANPDNDGQPLAWLTKHARWESDACLPWPYGRNSHGYGSIAFGGKHIGAHRAMCIIAHGEPPFPAAHAAHSCGRGHEGCVNPKHLRWASAAENHGDRRFTREGTRRVGNLKLTDSQCREMLARKGAVSQKALADEYGVSEAAVSRLFNGSRRGLAKSVSGAY